MAGKQTKKRKQAAEREPKGPLNVRLPVDAIAHCRERRLDTGVDLALQVLVGLIAYEVLPREVRTEMLRCATRVEQGEIAWATLLGALDSMSVQGIEQGVLKRMIQDLIQIADASEAERHLA